MKRLDEIRERCEKAQITLVSFGGVKKFRKALREIMLSCLELTDMYEFALGDVVRWKLFAEQCLETAKVICAERDAAISDMGQLANEHGSCFGCKWANSDYLRCDKPDDRMVRGEKCWEWRGVEGREDATDVD